MLSPNLFMILLKRQYNEIWSFLIVDINHFQFDLVHLFKKTKQESWHNCLLSILSRLLNRKEPLTQPQSSKLFKRFLKIIALAYIYQLSLVTLWVVVQKYSKLHPASCTNTHHDVTDLVNLGWLKIKKLNILRTEQNFSTK